MTRMTVKLGAAALLALGTVALPATGEAQDGAAKPPEAPAAVAPAPAPAAAEAPKPAEASQPAATPAPTSAPTPAPTAAEAPKPAEASQPAATPAPASAPTPAPAAAEAPKPTEVPQPAAAPAPASAPAPAASEAAKPTAPAGAAGAGQAAPPSAAAPAPAPDKAAAPPPEEVDLPERPVLSVEGKGAWEEAEDKLGGAFETLAIAAKKAGVKPAGAPLVEYVESDDAGFSFVVMLPIDKVAKGKLPKGVKAGVSPSGPALRFTPSVTTDDLDEVYARIDAYLTQNGLTLATMIQEYGEDAIASPEDRVVVDVYVFVE